MRFDDRLNTVLAQPALNAHDRAVRWRQLVELLARASDLSSPLAQRALAEILTDAQDIDQQLRSAAARAVASPHLPLPLVILFAADSVAVAAPVLAAASLQPSQWKDVLTTASSDSTRFIRSLYPELPAWSAATPPPSEPVYAVFEPVSEQGSVAEPEPEPEPEPVPQHAAADVTVEKEPEQSASASAPIPQPAHAGPAAPIPSISEVLARIEHLRQERHFARPLPQATTAPRRPAD